MFIFAQGVAQLIVLSLIVGATSIMLVTMTFTIPPQLVSRQFAGTAIGIAVTFWNLGGIVGPLAVGVAFSSSGGLVFPMGLMFVCLTIAAILTQIMKIP